MRTFCFFIACYAGKQRRGLSWNKFLPTIPLVPFLWSERILGTSLLLNKKKVSYKLGVCCYFSQILRINWVRGSAQSGFLLGNRRAKVSIFSAGTCVLRFLIERETSRSLLSKMRRRDKRDWMNNGRLCILFYLEPEQTGSTGSWRAS